MTENFKHVICDIDGTVTCASAPLKGEAWHDFFARAQPEWRIISLVQRLSLSGLKIVYITSRMEVERALTNSQLVEWGLPIGNSRLLMRGNDDHRHDYEIKLEYCRDEGLTPENVLFCLEDRDAMVRAYRDAGFTCLQVRDGSY